MGGACNTNGVMRNTSNILVRKLIGLENLQSLPEVGHDNNNEHPLVQTHRKET